MFEPVFVLKLCLIDATVFETKDVMIWNIFPVVLYRFFLSRRLSVTSKDISVEDEVCRPSKLASVRER